MKDTRILKMQGVTVCILVCSAVLLNYIPIRSLQRLMVYEQQQKTGRWKAGLANLPASLEFVVAIVAVAISTCLAFSDRLGQWLASVAPNVLPPAEAEAGAAVVREAIRQSKHCIRYGAEACLDKEGRVTSFYLYLSNWYLSPQQHVVELMLSVVILAPLCLLFFRACSAGYHYQREAGTFQMSKMSPVMKLWGATLLVFVIIGALMKIFDGSITNHPAYLWQPCHLHSVVMGLCAFWDSERSRAVLHVATTLWWGPFLIFVAPDLPSDSFEIVIFYAQHVMMLLVVLFRLTVGANWMYRDFWWNSAGYIILCCYHWWWLGPINIVTGINVATMSNPPVPLKMFGKYYRVVWGLACMLLQFLAVQVINLLARLVGTWPPSPSAALKATAAASSSSRPLSKGTDCIPSDAISVTPTEAVALVDGCSSSQGHHKSS
ncbi:unnamed protein product [Choristocarpus tenellus]